MRRSGSRAGVVLLGHQPNDVIAFALAVSAIGLPGLVAPGGLYVCGAAKEEFGLAIVEALGAGLTVVAPDVGGPATYVTDGDTGVLTDTRSVSGLRTAMGRARGSSTGQAESAGRATSRSVISRSTRWPPR